MTPDLKSLDLWRHTLVASVRADSPDLSSRQMALLLSVYLAAGPHTVRGLALRLGVSKPAISRALDRLGELGYVRRKRDDLDRRNVMVQRTVAGAVFLMEFAAMVKDAEQQLLHAPTPMLPVLPDIEDDSDDFAPAAMPHAEEQPWVDAAE